MWLDAFATNDYYKSKQEWRPQQELTVLTTLSQKYP